MDRLTAWLLERAGKIGPEWITAQGGWLNWTTDPNLALRLARRTDADHLAEIVEDCERITELVLAPSGEEVPLDLLLFCPRCGEQHVDKPQPEKSWDNPPHKSHECQFCGCVWRPSDRPTNGVASIATKGTVDNHTARPRYFATEADFEKAVAASEEH